MVILRLVMLECITFLHNKYMEVHARSGLIAMVAFPEPFDFSLCLKYVSGKTSHL